MALLSVEVERQGSTRRVSSHTELADNHLLTLTELEYNPKPNGHWAIGGAVQGRGDAGSGATQDSRDSLQTTLPKGRVRSCQSRVVEK